MIAFNSSFGAPFPTFSFLFYLLFFYDNLNFWMLKFLKKSESQMFITAKEFKVFASSFFKKKY